MKQRATPPVLEFRRRESVRDGARRLARTLTEAADEQLRTAALDREPAVHAMRLLLKRARALVRLLRPALGAPTRRRLLERQRAAARRLARPRDLAVGLALIDLLVRDANSDRRAAVQAVRRRFVERHPAPAPGRDTAVVAGLRSSATALREFGRTLQVTRWKVRGWTALEAGLEAAYRRARRRFGRAGTRSSEDAFHRWRSAVKTVQYHALLLRPASPRRLGKLVRSLDALGTCLGTEHDLAVLDARLAASPDDYGTPAAVASVRELLNSRRQYHRKQALKLGRRIFAPRPRAFLAALLRDWKTWRRS